MSKSFNTNFTLDLADCDIESEIDPPEKQTRDHPGCDAEVHLNSINFRGLDIPLNLFKRRELEEIKDRILDEANARAEGGANV